MIALCAALTGLFGILASTIFLRTYESSVVVRPQTAQMLVDLGGLLGGTPGTWYTSENVSDAVYQQFLRIILDRAALESALTSHRALFPGLDLDDRQVLSRLVAKFSVVPATDKGTLSDKFTVISFQYPRSWQAAEFLNYYVGESAVRTAETILSYANGTLTALRDIKLRDLARLREQRDIDAKQSAFKYREAFKTAVAAGIERPIVANLGNTAAIVAGNSQVPLYYYGTTILGAEIENISSRIGNDLAIPEFANIVSTMGDIAARLTKLAQIKIQPIVVSQPAVEFDKLVSLSWTGVTLLCLVCGAMLGFFLTKMMLRKEPVAGKGTEREQLVS